jgi:membrane protease YdiL (CAAX protease family)
VSRLADVRRHRFLILALLAGPLAISGLRIASHLGALEIPRRSLDWATVVNLLLLAPVLEELVFRGGVQGALDRTPFGRRYLAGGVSVGNALASALFSAAHLLVDSPWLAASIFFPSLVFGRLKQLYPSLLPAMLVHAWYNACYLIAGNLTPS